MRPPVFVVGAPRSGTGVLRDLLRAHAGLAFPGESHFVPHFYRAWGDPADAAAARALAARVLGFERVRRWGLGLAPGDFADCRRYADVVDRIFAAWAAREGKPRWGDKTPHYVSHLVTLAEIFPELRVLHIVRDGRAVAASWAAHPTGPGNHYVAARTWCERVRAGRRGAASLPAGSYHEVRYEALLADPEAELAAILAFLGEPPLAGPVAMAPPPLARDRHFRGVSSTELVRDHADAWRAGMTPRQRRVVEAVAGELLRELGYDVDAPPPPLSAPERLLYTAHARAYRYARLARSPRLLRDHAALLLARLRGAGAA